MERSPRLDRYKGIVDEKLIDQIYAIARSLDGLHVLHINTTAQGGGVAEILHELIPQMQELGIRHDWKVVQLDAASGYFTARLADMMQGYDMGAFPEAEKQVFLEKLQRQLWDEQDYRADLYFVVSTLPKSVDRPGQTLFLSPWIDPACQCSFHIPAGYFPRWCPQNDTGWNIAQSDQQEPHHFEHVCSCAYGPGLDQWDCPPQPSPIRHLAGQGGISRSSLGAAASETPGRSCDAHSQRR